MSVAFCFVVIRILNQSYYHIIIIVHMNSSNALCNTRYDLSEKMCGFLFIMSYDSAAT